MAQAKIQLFDADLQTSAEFFKALAHPARLAILKYLAVTRTCITADFAEELPLSRTTVNQHLTELKNAELIKHHTEGVKTYYCLNIEKIQDFKKILEIFMGEISNPENCCEQIKKIEV